MREANTNQENSEEELCQKCGEVLLEENGKKYCPKCETEINFFGDDDEL